MNSVYNSNPEGFNQYKKRTGWLKTAGKVGLIAGGALAGGVLGARTLPRMLGKGRVLQAGESLAGKILYHHEGLTTPAQVIVLPASKKISKLTGQRFISVEQILRRASKDKGLKGKVARAARKVDEFLGIPQRHYGVGLGAGRVADITRGEGQRIIPAAKFGKDIRVHGEGKLVEKGTMMADEAKAINPKEAKALEGRYAEMKDWKKGDLCTIGDKNCEAYARGVGEGRKLSTQIRALKAGFLGGAAVGATPGVAMSIPRKENQEVRNMLQIINRWSDEARKKSAETRRRKIGLAAGVGSVGLLAAAVLGRKHIGKSIDLARSAYKLGVDRPEVAGRLVKSARAKWQAKIGGRLGKIVGESKQRAIKKAADAADEIKAGKINADFKNMMRHPKDDSPFASSGGIRPKLGFVDKMLIGTIVGGTAANLVRIARAKKNKKQNKKLSKKITKNEWSDRAREAARRKRKQNRPKTYAGTGAKIGAVAGAGHQALGIAHAGPYLREMWNASRALGVSRTRLGVALGTGALIGGTIRAGAGAGIGALAGSLIRRKRPTNNIREMLQVINGGPGSGFHGHKGIPGHRGGSVSEGKSAPSVAASQSSLIRSLFRAPVSESPQASARRTKTAFTRAARLAEIFSSHAENLEKKRKSKWMPLSKDELARLAEAHAVAAGNFQASAEQATLLRSSTKEEQQARLEKAAYHRTQANKYNARLGRKEAISGTASTLGRAFAYGLIGGTPEDVAARIAHDVGSAGVDIAATSVRAGAQQFGRQLGKTVTETKDLTMPLSEVKAAEALLRRAGAEPLPEGHRAEYTKPNVQTTTRKKTYGEIAEAVGESMKNVSAARAKELARQAISGRARQQWADLETAKKVAADMRLKAERDNALRRELSPTTRKSGKNRGSNGQSTPKFTPVDAAVIRSLYKSSKGFELSPELKAKYGIA